MDAGLYRVIASACLLCASTVALADDGPATATAPATDLDNFSLVSSLGDPAFRHDGTVTKGLILSDGRRMITSGNDGTARLWDLQTGRQIQCYRHTKKNVWDVLPLPGEEKFLTAGGEAKAVLWDLATAARLAEYPHGKMTFRLALDANAARLAVGDQDGFCVLWDLADKSQIARFGPGGGSRITAVLFGPRGNTLIAGSEDSTIRSWTLDSNGETFLKHKDRKLKLAQMLGGKADTEDIYTLAASPDGSRIVVCCAKRGPWLLEPNIGREVWKAKDVPPAYDAAWSPDGAAIAVSESNCLWVLDPATGAARWSAPWKGGTHYGVTWSPDGNEILCGSNNLLCRYAARGPAAGKRVYPPEGAPLQQYEVKAALPSPDGELIYESGSSAGVRAWDRRRRQVKATWLEKEPVRRLALSGDGLTLAAGADRFVAAIDTRTGKEIHRFPRESDSGDFAFTPDGTMIALSGMPGLALFRVPTGQKVIDLTGDAGQSYYYGGMAVSGDMELAFTNGVHVHLCKLPGGEPLQVLGPAPRTVSRGPFASPQVDDSSDDKAERFAGCAFIPGQASYLITWGNKHLQLWTPTITEANALSNEEAAKLVEQLNADSFQDRETATKRLSAAGRAVLPLLRAVQTKDPEQLARLELVQKEILVASRLRMAGSVDLKEGGTCSFALHPDGRHWALACGEVPDREVLLGEVTGQTLRVLTTLHAGGAANVSAPSTVAIDKAGLLIIGNCNGTISEYKIQPATQPATAAEK